MADGKVKIRIDGDPSGFEAAIGKVGDGVGKLGSIFQGVGLAVGQQLTQGLGAAAGVLTGAIDKASDWNETIAKSGVLFTEELVPAMEDWAETGAASFGQSKQQALDAAATFAVFGKSAGLAGEELTDFSKTQVELASDLASFHNTSPQEAIDAIGAAMRGEAEPMRRYGVLLDDATMRSKALEMGLISSTKEALTPQNKVLAANALILEKTKDAQGDFARTSGGLANSQRTLSAQWENMQIQIGEKLLPVKLALTRFILERLLPALSKIGEIAVPIFKEISGGFKAFVAAFKAGDGDVTSSGFPGFMEKIAFFARLAFDWIKENVPPTLAALKEGFNTVVDFIQNNVLPLWPVLVDAFQFVVSAVEEKFMPLWPKIVEMFQAAVDTIVPIANTIVNIFHFIVDTALFIWDQFGGQLISILKAVWDTIWGVLGGVIQIITGIFNLIKDVLTGNWSGAWNDIKQILSGAWTAIWAIVEGAWRVLLNIMSIAWDAIKGAVGLAWDGIKALIQAAWDAQVGIASDAIGKVVEFFGGLAGKIGGVIGGLAGTITAPFRDAFNSIADLWNRTVGAISFQVPGWVPGMGGKGFDVPNVPTFAEGGLAFSPMLAIVGDHKSGGAEIIAPEAKMAKVVRENSGPGIVIENLTIGQAGLPQLMSELDWMVRLGGLTPQ